VAALILDASVLIGLLDSADAHHAQSVRRVEDADNDTRALIAPASAYSEALVAFARHHRLHDARDAIAGMGIAIAPLTASMAEQAAQLRARHRTQRLPDAMVLACARVLDGELYSHDRRLMRLA
jgi:predicted nucleic acid-binding protein